MIIILYCEKKNIMDWFGAVLITECVHSLLKQWDCNNKDGALWMNRENIDILRHIYRRDNGFRENAFVTKSIYFRWKMIIFEAKKNEKKLSLLSSFGQIDGVERKWKAILKCLPTFSIPISSELQNMILMANAVKMAEANYSPKRRRSRECWLNLLHKSGFLSFISTS